MFRNFFVAIAIFALSLTTPNIVLADAYSDAYERMQQDIEQSSRLIEIGEANVDADTMYYQLTQDLPLLKQHFLDSELYYSNLSASESDIELKEILNDLSIASGLLAQDLSQAEIAMSNSDFDSFTFYMNSYDQHADQYNTAKTNLDNNFNEGHDTTDYGLLLFFATLGTGIVSFALFFISRGDPLLPSEKLRNQFEFELFKSSLWPFGGALISYVWYLLTPAGGTYYILWWLIAFGLFQFGRGLYSYLRHARPAINAAKIQEQGKLDKLLNSKDFQKETVVEKLAEIKKMKPIINIGK